jgi:phosphatidate cytidylyltransferase
VLRWRLLAATLIILPLLGLLVADFRTASTVPGVWLWPLPLLLTTLAVSEVLDLLAGRGFRPAAWSTHLGTLLVVVTGLTPVFQHLLGPLAAWSQRLDPWEWSVIALAAGAALAFMAEMWRFREPGQSVLGVALGILTMVYLGLPMNFLAALRLFHNNHWGMVAVVSTIFVVKMSDTGAYACGRLFGRRPLAPLLSPKKTVEGFLGGLATGCLCAVLFLAGIAPLMLGQEFVVQSLGPCLLYGLVVSLAGVIGDLSESLLKRDMQRKDSSSWMPGLGGVLDVLDSLLFAAPASYLCWVLGLVGP